MNKKVFNCAAWITLLITYIFPYNSTNASSTCFGYPFSFLTVYKTSINTSLFKTENIDLFPLAIDILLVFFVINFIMILLRKLKSTKYVNKVKDAK